MGASSWLVFALYPEEVIKNPLLVSKKRQNASSYLPELICRNWHLDCLVWLPRLHRAGPSASLDKSEYKVVRTSLYHNHPMASR
jgi:hypothetical protein